MPQVGLVHTRRLKRHFPVFILKYGVYSCVKLQLWRVLWLNLCRENTLRWVSFRGPLTSKESLSSAASAVCSSVAGIPVIVIFLLRPDRASIFLRAACLILAKFILCLRYFEPGPFSLNGLSLYPSTTPTYSNITVRTIRGTGLAPNGRKCKERMSVVCNREMAIKKIQTM